MKRTLCGVYASVALVAGLSSAEPAAAANPPASCAGLVGASLAGESGARAVIAQGFIAEAQSGGTPGDLQSEWSRLHQPMDGCLEFITP